MSEYALPTDATLMILDDDGPFRSRLGRAMEQRGFTVNAVESIQEARSIVNMKPPALSLIHI